jgi:hypothetical protein
MAKALRSIPHQSLKNQFGAQFKLNHRIGGKLSKESFQKGNIWPLAVS